jgi:hypothetical protein
MRSDGEKGGDLRINNTYSFGINYVDCSFHVLEGIIGCIIPSEI